MPGSFSLPYPSSPATNDAPVSLPIRANFQSLQSQINNADGAALQAKTVTEQALADAINPRLRRSDGGESWLVPGGIAGGFSGLTASLTAGTAYVQGYYIPYLGGNDTVAINQDTYASIDVNGNVTFQGVANNAAMPSLPANSMWVGKWVSNGTAITSFTDISYRSPTRLGNINGINGVLADQFGGSGGGFTSTSWTNAPGWSAFVFTPMVSGRVYIKSQWKIYSNTAGTGLNLRLLVNGAVPTMGAGGRADPFWPVSASLANSYDTSPGYTTFLVTAGTAYTLQAQCQSQGLGTFTIYYAGDVWLAAT